MTTAEELLDLQRQEDAIRARKRVLQGTLNAIMPEGGGVTAATRATIDAVLDQPMTDDDWTKVRQSIRCLAQGKRLFHSGERTAADGTFIRCTVHVGQARAKQAMKVNGFEYAAGEVVWAEDLAKDPSMETLCEPLAKPMGADRAVAELLKCCKEHKLHPVRAGQKLASLDDRVFQTLQSDLKWSPR